MLFFIFLSFCLCLYFSICSVYLSVYMCLSFSFCLSFSLCLSFCLCLFLCLCLSYSFSFCFCFSSLWQNTAVAFLQFLFLLNLPFYKYKKKSILGKRSLKKLLKRSMSASALVHQHQYIMMLIYMALTIE